MKTSKQVLVRSIILAIGLYSADSSAATYMFRKLIPGAKQSCHASELSGPLSFAYTGSVQSVPVPAGAAYAEATVGGAGGGGSACYTQGAFGGNGDALSGRISVKKGETLEVLVGQGGGYSYDCGPSGGGGLSGIFSGVPSKATALIVAGGGGGGDYRGSNGTNAGFHPAATSAKGSLGGAGYGGGGIANNTYAPGAAGSPFGAGGSNSCGGAGGFGGGGGGGGGAAGGGGGGLPGGSGGYSVYNVNANTLACNAGQGGTSFAAPSVKQVQESAGPAGGSPGLSGSNGSVEITFYSCG